MTQPLAHTENGDIRGFTHNGMLRFFRVPYCKASDAFVDLNR